MDTAQTPNRGIDIPMDTPNIHKKIDSAAARAKEGVTKVDDRATELGQTLEHAAEAASESAGAAASKTAAAIEEAAHEAKRRTRELARKAKKAVHDATEAEPEGE